MSADILRKAAVEALEPRWLLTVTFAQITPPASAVAGSLATVSVDASSDTNSITGETVNWGDGSAPDTLTANAASDSHSYALAGTYWISMTAFDADPSSLDATPVSLVVTPAPIQLSAPDLALDVQQHYTGSLGTIGGVDPSPASYSGSLQFHTSFEGGTDYTRAVSFTADGLGNALIDISNLDGFAAGSYPATLGITEAVNGQSISASAAFTINVEPPALSAQGAGTIVATLDQAWSGDVATFTAQSHGSPSAADFSATTDFGDATAASSDTITATGGGTFDVSATHTFAKAGSLSLATTVAHPLSGATVNAATSAQVDLVPFSVSTSSVSFTEGQSFGTSFATLADQSGPGSATHAGDYSATLSINGQTHAVTLATDADQTDLDASLAALSTLPAGSYQATLNVTESNNGVSNSTSTTVNVTIADVALTSPQGQTIAATVGTSWSGPIATFVDPDPNAQASYFTAQVNYGDGSGTSTATTIAVDPNVVGGWIVSASHTFILGGSLSATVTITDAADGTNDNAITAISTATVAVPAPASLYANGISTGEIDLSWTLLSNDVASVEIDRSADGQTWSALATLPGAPTSYADTSAVAATPYWYRAIASEGPSYTGAAQSPPSTPAEAIAPPPTPTATALDGNSVQLQWTGDAPASVSFNVQRTSNIDTGTTTFTNVSTGYTDTTALDGVPYTYALVATTGSVSSNPSAATTVTTPLAPPTGFSATPISTGEIDLTWSLTSSQQDIVTVERSTDNQTFTDLATVSPGTTTFNDTTATAGTHYWYQLIASEQYTGASPSSVSAAAASDEWSLPDAPAGLTAAASLYNGVELSWDATAGAANYTIERSDDGGVTFNPVGTVNGSTTTFGDMGVLPAASYSYRVEALTATGGQSAASTVATVSTPTGCVSGLAATAVSDGEIDLAWSTGSVTSGLQLLQSTDGSTFTAVQTFTSPTTSYAVTGLTQDTHYWFQLVDSATVGWTVNTDTWTLPPAPTSLSAAATSDGGVDLNWAMDDEPSAAFVVQRAVAGTGDYASVGTATVDRFHDATADPSLDYDYIILAIGNNQQHSNPSNVASITAGSTPSTTPATPPPPPGGTTTLYVDNSSTTSSGTPNGTSGHPYVKITDAVKYLVPGDTVDIAPGIYRETVTPPSGTTGATDYLSAVAG